MQLSPYTPSDPWAWKDAAHARQMDEAWDEDLRIEERLDEILASSEEMERVMESFMDGSPHLYQIFISALQQVAVGKPEAMQRHLKAAAYTLAVKDITAGRG